MSYVYSFLQFLSHSTFFSCVILSDMTEDRDTTHSLFSLNSLVVFVIVYISLFVIAIVILFTVLPKVRQNKDSIPINFNKQENLEFLKSYEKFHNPERETAKQMQDFYPSFDDLLKHSLFRGNDSNYLRSYTSTSFYSHKIDLNWPYGYSALINCSSIQEVSDLRFVASGWTKAVFKGKFNGLNVAVKVVNSYGHDIQQCQKLYETTICMENAEMKILKEIILLHELAHNNVIKVLGFCIPDNFGTVVLVTELGDSLDLVHLLQISWEDRLRLVLGMAHLLHYLANSPLGSLSMNDFRRQQFVIVNGELKLSDVDDLGIGEPHCVNDESCGNISPSTVSQGRRVVSQSLGVFRCINFHCVGHNSRHNVWHAGQHFVKLFLPIGAPSNTNILIDKILEAYELAEECGEFGYTACVVSATFDLVNFYQSGLYFNGTGEGNKAGFKKLEDCDLPGMFDYYCRNSISAVGCVMSVLNEEEAVQFCMQDVECKAVVLTKEKTWTGRTMAVFKNGTSQPHGELGFTLLIKADPM